MSGEHQRKSVRDRAVDLANEAGARALHLTERAVVRASLVPTTPFLPTDTFDWVPGLEAEWKTIREELDEVLSYRDALPNFQDISIDQASITDETAGRRSSSSPTASAPMRTAPA